MTDYQARVIEFRWRYGYWVTETGREVLFNRRYHPLYHRASVDSEARAAALDEWVEGIVQTKTAHAYNDGTPEREKRAAAIRFLLTWGLPVPNCARKAEWFWENLT